MGFVLVHLAPLLEFSGLWAEFLFVFALFVCEIWVLWLEFLAEILAFGAEFLTEI